MRYRVTFQKEEVHDVMAPNIVEAARQAHRILLTQTPGMKLHSIVEVSPPEAIQMHDQEVT